LIQVYSQLSVFLYLFLNYGQLGTRVSFFCFAYFLQIVWLVVSTSEINWLERLTCYVSSGTLHCRHSFTQFAIPSVTTTASVSTTNHHTVLHCNSLSSLAKNAPSLSVF